MVLIFCCGSGGTVVFGGSVCGDYGSVSTGNRLQREAMLTYVDPPLPLLWTLMR